MISGFAKGSILALLGAMGSLQCSQAADTASYSSGSAPQRLITNASQLKDALKNAVGGEVLTLAPGDYGNVDLSNVRFPKTVRVTSSRALGARFDRLSLSNVGNISFSSVELGRGLKPGEPNYTNLVLISGSRDVALDHVRVRGSLDGDPTNDANGVRIIKSERVDLANSKLEQLRMGVIASQSSDVSIRNNDIHDIQSDGVHVAEVRGITIDGNRISNFQPKPGDHPDAIQFFTNGTKTPSSDIRITNNLIFQGKGAMIQGIFLSDELGTLPYRNALIANNLVYVNHWHGISVSGAGDVEIKSNSVLSEPGDAVSARILVRNVRNARIENNIADEYVTLDRGKFTASHNLFLKDQPGKARMIPNARAGPRAKVEDLVVRGYGHQPSAIAAWQAPARRPPG